MNDLLNVWGAIFSDTATGVWISIVNFIPNILGAIVVILIGMIVAGRLGRAVALVLKKLYIDQAVDKAGLTKVLHSIGMKFDVSVAFGKLITWFLYVIALIIVADILQLNQISQFLQSVVLYIPNVIISVVILVVGIIISNFIYTLIKETATSAQLAAADLLAMSGRWAILVFTFLAALEQLRVVPELIQILFTGLVFMIALAGGLAFGLAGKDRAKDILDKVGRK